MLINKITQTSVGDDYGFSQNEQDIPEVSIYRLSGAFTISLLKSSFPLSASLWSFIHKEQS